MPVAAPVADDTPLAAKERLLSDNLAAMPAFQGRYGIIGNSAQAMEVLKYIELAGPAKSNVVIRGETGTGKELVARALHLLRDPEYKHPFVKVNCAAIPNDLFESEMFGYEKGAFTGASYAKPGRFELANKGTLFLDEMGDLSQNHQAKILRVLEEKEVARLGSTKVHPVDVRIIAATNKDLEAEVARGNFREDLYYRLNVVPIQTPSLAERPGDIRLIAQYFLEQLIRRYQMPAVITDDGFRYLERLKYRGNIRELQNIIERAYVLNPEKGEMDKSHFEQLPQMPERIITLNTGTPVGTPVGTNGYDIESMVRQIQGGVALDTLMQSLRSEIANAILEKSGGNKSRTSEILSISKKTLDRLLEVEGTRMH